jgi:hypothetical protein
LFACDADLTIKYQGFLPNSDRDMGFVVTNTGGAASPATTAQLATLSTAKPEPETNQRDVPIPALDPGASYGFTYSLPSTCDGNNVQATVVLDSDPNQGNLSTQVGLCGPIQNDQRVPAQGASDLVLPPPPAPDTQIQRRGPSDISRDVALATPDYLQPGDHEMSFTPTVETERQRYNDYGVLGCLSGTAADAGWSKVGWAQGLGETFCATAVSQTAARFDIGSLLQGGPKLVTSATQFDVTVPVEDWFGTDSPRYGFVLKGSLEDLNNDDQSSCMSEVQNIRLTIDYTVL